MKPRSRDAMKLIRAMTKKDKPLNILKLDDDAAYQADKKALRGYVPTPEQIAAECKLIRAEKSESVEQAAIHELINADDEELE